MQKQFYQSYTWNHQFEYTSTWKNKCRHYKPDGLWIKCNFNFLYLRWWLSTSCVTISPLSSLPNACILIPCSTIFFLDASDNEFSKHHNIFSFTRLQIWNEGLNSYLVTSYRSFEFKTCVWTRRTSVTIKWRHRNNFAAELQAQNIYVYNLQYNNTIVIMLSLSKKTNKG